MSDPTATSAAVDSVIRGKLDTKIPAVDPITRELNYTSVSALTKFNHAEYGGCNSRWWFKYVMGFKETQTVQQAEGVKGHTQIEHYLPTLPVEDVLGPIAAAGRHLLPTPSKDLMVEWGLNDKPRPPDITVKVRPALLGSQGQVILPASFERKQINFFPPEESLLRADGLPLIGFMDWINPTGWYVNPQGVLTQDPPNTVECGDNKFTGNVKYAKKPQELIDSTQMAGYTAYLTMKYPQLKQARASHVYFQTRDARKAVKTTVLMPLETIHNSWQKRGHDVVQKMREVARIRREEDVPANLESCDSYRKSCDFKGQCSKFQRQQPIDRLKSLLLQSITTPEVKTMSLLTKVRAAAPTNGAAAVNGTITNTPWVAQPAPGPAAVAVPLTAKEAVSGQAYRFSNGAVGMFLSAVGMGNDIVYAFLQVGSDGKAGSQPFHVAPTEVVVHIPTAAVETAPAPAAAAAPVVVSFSPPAAAAPVATLGKKTPKLLIEAEAPEVKRDVEAPPAPAPLAAQTGAAPKRAVSAKAKKEGLPAEGGNGIRLYVACVPSGPYEALDGYIGSILTDLQAAHKVDDIRFAPDANHALAFGRWEGALAATVRAFPPIAGDYVAFRGSKITDVVVEALAPLCGPGNVVRGV